MNNTERELWLLNDEPIHNFWKSTRLSKREFLKKHRNKIDTYIEYKLDKHENTKETKYNH